jgi:nucleoprotein TPR
MAADAAALQARVAQLEQQLADAHATAQATAIEHDHHAQEIERRYIALTAENERCRQEAEALQKRLDAASQVCVCV